MSYTPHQILKKYWGYTQFRSNQLSVIEQVLAKKDALVLMPTGGGKSLCYQIPALIFEGICIVVSPLLALMEDQVSQLKQKGIKAEYIKPGTSYSDLEVLLNNCIHGDYKFLYVSPERLQSEIVSRYLDRMKVSVIAIDEAHCISEWGHDFRPSYQKLSVLKTAFAEKIPFIALTATATDQVQKDVISQLLLDDYQVFKTSYKRENISYGVYETEDKNYLLQKIVLKNKGAIIVYVPTRQLTHDLSNFIQAQGVSVVNYHGGLSREEKSKNFKSWFTNASRVMVATNAFGMGIDKPDVRVVLHYYVPDSIENYFQEAGRAGRDGEKSYAMLLKTGSSIPSLKNKFNAQTPDLDFIKYVYRKLSSYFQVSYGEGEFQVYNMMFNDFCKRYDLSRAKVYTSLNILDKNGIIAFNERYQSNSKLHITSSLSGLLHYIGNHPNYDDLVHYVTRNYPGVFTQETFVNVGLIAENTQMSQNRVVELLLNLKDQQICEFEHSVSDCQIEYLVPREDELAINRVSKPIKKHLKNSITKIKKVIEFVENDTDCKSVQLLKYFGENSSDCGVCSVCISKSKKTSNKKLILDYKVKILEFLKEQDLHSRELEMKLTLSEADLITTLHALMEEGSITLTPENLYKIKD